MNMIVVGLTLVVGAFVMLCDGWYFDWRHALMKVAVAITAYLLAKNAIARRCADRFGTVSAADLIMVRVIAIAVLFAAFVHAGLGALVIIVCLLKQK